MAIFAKGGYLLRATNNTRITVDETVNNRIILNLHCQTTFFNKTECGLKMNVSKKNLPVFWGGSLLVVSVIVSVVVVVKEVVLSGFLVRGGKVSGFSGTG